MASVWVVKRTTRAGEARFHVKWEGPPVPLVDGQRFRAQLHLGAFRTEREARARVRWAREEWAEGRIPDPKRIVTTAIAARRVTVAAVARDWLESRVDLAAASIRQYRSRCDRIVDDLGSLSVEDVTPAVVRGWVAELAGEFAPSTTGIYLHVLRLVLDHAGQEPNAARHRSVKLPKGRTANVRIRLPSSRELALIADALPVHHRRLLDFLEDTGLRIEEACLLGWSDVERERILVRGSKRTASIRWVDTRLHPIRLLSEQPGEGLVFAVKGSAFRNALTKACAQAGTNHYSPHDLRHLHGSRLVHGGASPADVAARLGHANAATTLRVYTHVIVPA
jgi:integrase